MLRERGTQKSKVIIGAQYQYIVPLTYIWFNHCNSLKLKQTTVIWLLQCGEYYLERVPVVSLGSL